ncbi:MAG: hypothetical protein KAH86_02535 [Methanosarcinales archaeon]|nr:hypothetical protein [Methanosarcinales archaeon]
MENHIEHKGHRDNRHGYVVGELYNNCFTMKKTPPPSLVNGCRWGGVVLFTPASDGKYIKEEIISDVFITSDT